MNTVKVIIPLVEITKLVPNLPPGKIETITKWEGNAVCIFSGPDINHNLPGPMPFDQWLEKNPPKQPEPTEPAPATDEPTAAPAVRVRKAKS